MVMKFFAVVSIAVVLGFLGFRLLSDGTSPNGNGMVSSRTDPQRFAIQSQQDAGLNAIRQDAYTSAMAYAASPCDPANKAKLIKAFAAYVAAARSAYGGCKFVLFCSGGELQAALNALSTPLDARVKASLTTAFSRGGIDNDDLPLEIRISAGLANDLRSPRAQCSGPNIQAPVTGSRWSRS